MIASADHWVRVVGNGRRVPGPVCGFRAVGVDRLHADLVVRPARRDGVDDGLRGRDSDLGVGSGIDPAFPDVADRVAFRVGGPAGRDRQGLAGARGPVGNGRRGRGRLIPLNDISPVGVRCIGYQGVRGQKQSRANAVAAIPGIGPAQTAVGKDVADVVRVAGVRGQKPPPPVLSRRQAGIGVFGLATASAVG